MESPPEPSPVRETKAEFDAQQKNIEELENKYKKAEIALRKDPENREASMDSVAASYALVKAHACLYKLNLSLLEAMDKAEAERN